MFARMDYLYVVIFVNVLLIRHGLSTTYEEVIAATGERPMFNGVMGKFLNYPGLTFEPNLDAERGLIRYEAAVGNTYQQYIDRLQSVLEKYQNEYQQTEHGDMVDCAAFSQYRHTEDVDKSCRFDLMYLGSECVLQEEFGYYDRKPCIALTLERIMNWVPESYTNESVPDIIRDNWSPFAITVHCEGEDPVSKDNLGPVTYHQPTGFDFKYFPYTGQSSWVNPLMFVRLEQPPDGIAVRVTCTAYAKNMKHDNMMSTGKVTFEILID